MIDSFNDSLAAKTKQPVYRLGRALFSVTHHDSAFEQVLARIFPLCEDEPNQDKPITGVNMETFDVRELVKLIVERQIGCLRIDAACLTSPAGQKVLISGRPDTGKSTTALALVFGHDWKVLAEGSTFIDPIKQEIIGFAAPFSLKQETRAVLAEAAQVSLPSFILYEWLPIGSQNLAHDQKIPFDVVVHFDGGPNHDSLSCSSMSISEYLLQILPMSNLLAIKGGTQKFLDYVKDGSCYRFSGGGLTERINRILELCSA